MNSELIPISKLKLNTGQVEGLPKNPRFIKDDKYNKLKASIEADPEMLDLREVIAYDNGTDLVVIGGNMRLRVCQELGIKKIPTKVLPKETPIEKLKAYLIKDNVSFGDWSMDDLANEWSTIELENWGVDLPEVNEKENGEIIFSNELDFESNYIVLKFSTDIDFLNIQTIFGIKSTYSKRANGKPWSKGIGRVVDGVDAIIKIKES